MKTIVLLITILTTTYSFGRVGDLSFFPERGTYYYRVAIDYYAGDIEGSTAGVSFDYDYKHHEMIHAFSFSFMEKFHGGLKLRYFLTDETEVGTTAAAGGNNELNQDGLYDPILFAEYRLFNESEMFANVDLNAELNFSLEDREKGDSTNGSSGEGNASTGGFGLKLWGEGSKAWNDFEFLVNYGFHFFAGRDQETLTNPTSTEDYDSKLDVFLDLMAQYKWEHDLTFVAHIGIKRVGGEEYSSNQTGTTTNVEEDGYFQVIINPAVRWNFMDGFAASFGPQVIHQGSYDQTSTTVGATTGTTLSYDSTSFLGFVMKGYANF